MPLKIVCDTNVLVSASLWRGKPKKLLDGVAQRKALLYLSPALFQELAKVLGYERLRPFVRSERKILQTIRDLAILVDPIEHVRVIQEDPSDDRVLECALAANADFIVTGDQHLLKRGSFHGIPIIAVKEALKKIFKKP